jgi:endo-1,4-beta-xylanase
VKRTLVAVGFLLLAALPPIAGASSAGTQVALRLPEPETDEAVRDRKPPELRISVSPEKLTNPNGRLRTIEISGEAEDDTELEEIYLASVESDEAGEARDIAGERIGRFDDEVLLRAERSANGNGRTYRITYVAVDAAGNRATATATVSVPAD